MSTLRSLLRRHSRLAFDTSIFIYQMEAARLRAVHRLRTPDALQAATAIRSGATGIVSNDAAFARLGSVAAILLDAFL
ncbi:MAG: PIN domain-containing protein [Candidatus Solibacter usitatus]|nr:PIN domain-containing protein [Candidatus Solibacter usitatus]